MEYTLSIKNKKLNARIRLPLSKSESNRILILRALCGDKEKYSYSEAEDTQTLQTILNEFENGKTHFDVKAAGTTMRFLMAYFASRPCAVTLTGSERIKERPVKELVNALKETGADIRYIEIEGFLPVAIKGKKLKGGIAHLPGNISSQFISALLMIAPTMEKGLQLEITSNLVSEPYVAMTIALMKEFGVEVQKNGDGFNVLPQPYKPAKVEVEADWSAASYWYEIAALSKETHITLVGLKANSLQGDAVLPKLFEPFGVETTFEEKGVVLTKKDVILPENFEYDFSNCPDLAQTVAVTVSALGILTILSGLQTLTLKETDRVKALSNELTKLGVSVTIQEEGSISIESKGISETNSPIETYTDHRMAMAFAPLAMLLNEISISDPGVVQKSYPRFWDDLRSAGFDIKG